MKKKCSDFPWYLIYTPIVFVVFALWFWDWQTGDNTMDVLEKILIWLGIDNKLVVNVLIIALAFGAFLYIVVKWFATSKKLKAIAKVTDTAPENVTQYVDDIHADLDAAIKDASNDICNLIDKDKLALAQDLAVIKSNTSFIISHRSEAPVQQSQLLSEIASLYALHDRDQDTISEQKEEIQRLMVQNSKLAQQNKRLQEELKELRPDPHFEHRIR